MIFTFFWFKSLHPLYGETLFPDQEPRTVPLVIQTSTVLGLMGLGMTFLWMLPEEKSQWYDKPDLTPSALYKRWKYNIGRGPVWDNDMRMFNAYSHIHVGAIYGSMCLDHGYSFLFCNVYTNLLSMAWEYGPESLTEVPSWQDILMTGLVGASVGAQFHFWDNEIKANNGEVWGSSTLGYFLRLIMNPIRTLSSHFKSAKVEVKVVLPEQIRHPKDMQNPTFFFGLSI